MERCNGLDDNCDGEANFQIAPGDTEDDDGDGAVDVECPILGVDCDDFNPAVQGAAEEICDGVDNDCDATVDEQLSSRLWYRDADGDGFGSEGAGSVFSCVPVAGHVIRAGDCADADRNRYPGQNERCNGLDDDCDSDVDEAVGNECAAVNGLAACFRGQCQIVSCQPGFGDCDGRFANGCELALGGATNCSACGDVCAPGDACVGQRCRSMCTESSQCRTGETCCTASCVDTQRDPSHCGRCGNQCDFGFSCRLGNCEPPCVPEAEVCDGADQDCDSKVDESVCRCGDGVTDSARGELCDDGNTRAGDGCSASCRSNETCGNRVVDTPVGETCDDGGTQPGDGCDDRCRREDPVCGDGRRDMPEEICDDGNTRDGDGCSSTCISDETCGNRVIDSAIGERCDDGNTRDGDGCSSTCRLENCGNRMLEAGEVCDDGNFRAGDGCSPDCRSNETCGNGILDRVTGEECDDGNTTPADGCGANCRLCGDGACDDPGEDCARCALDCGACADFCGNGTCGPGENCNRCEADCDECAPTCFDGVCDSGEDAVSCPADCGLAPACGDSVCEGAEDCMTCRADCGPCAGASCGDRTCQAGQEDCRNCPGDCGTCSVTCGTDICEPDQTCATCPDDCGDCAPVCGDGECVEGEDCNGCASDCGACSPTCDGGACDAPSETCATCARDCGPCGPVCGDAMCEAGETCTSCAADCGSCAPACGNGTCGLDEDCVSCPPDCGACAGTCGDGLCTGVESCTNCPIECGSCSSGDCGDGTCAPGEGCRNCVADCGACASTCGNGRCDPGEGCTSCPDDCAAPETCDGRDNDCDGTADDGDPGGGASCSTGRLGVCAPGNSRCVGGAIQCVQQTAASAEICSSLDDDCDGTVDEGSNECGGACAIPVPVGTACDAGGLLDRDTCLDDVFVCNGRNATVCENRGMDTDMDGFSAGAVECRGDCNDMNDEVSPGGVEICDTLDNDCDGFEDEVCGCEEYVWDGGGSSAAWNDPLNWDLDRVPGLVPNHCVTIPAGALVEMTEALPFALTALRIHGTLTHPIGSTAGVSLRVGGELVLSPTGVIDVAARGLLGASSPGAGSDGSACSCGAGLGGGGAGHGGIGGSNANGASAGVSHGAIASPTALGARGGVRACGGRGAGGAGGGRVRIQVGGTFRFDGQIHADGRASATACSNGGGAGGSVWISAGSIVETGGAPVITADGGAGTTDATCGCGGSGGGGGAGGRIAIDGYAGELPAGLTLSARGGAGVPGSRRGGAGTIYTKPAAQPLGDLRVDNGAADGAPTPLSSTALAAYETLTVAPLTTLVTAVPLTVGHLQVEGTLTHEAADEGGVFVTAGDATIAAGGLIDAVGLGHGQLAGPGAGRNGATCACGAGLGGSGGGHGGRGGSNVSASPAGGLDYGPIASPLELGSGGGLRACQASGSAGRGGGIVRLVVDRVLTLDGDIRVDGGAPSSNCSQGGGAGGSVWITAGAVRTSSTPTISANGSAGVNDSTCGCGGSGGGGGAGGRIAIDDFAGSLPAGLTLEAFGGAAATGERGAAGTIYTRSVSEPNGHLEIDNGGSAGGVTHLPDATNALLRDLIVRGGAHARLDTEDGVQASVVTIEESSVLTTSTPLMATTVTVDGTLTHLAGEPDGVTLACDDLDVGATGRIDVSGRGFGQLSGPGAGRSGDVCTCGNGLAGSGAGHGGPGGSGHGGSPSGGGSYDSIEAPSELGSGGGLRACAGRGTAGLGGGRVRLIVADQLTLDGEILANGTTSATHCSNSGGSGGAIWISAGRVTTAGTPAIRADGGGGTSDSTCGCGGIGAGSGAGGRIAIDGYSGSLPGALVITARAGSPAGNGGRGAAGTIFRRAAGQPLGDLEVDAAVAAARRPTSSRGRWATTSR